MSLTFPENCFCRCAGTVCDSSSLGKRKSQERRKIPNGFALVHSRDGTPRTTAAAGHQGEVTDGEFAEKSVLTISSQEGELATAVQPRLDQEWGGWMGSGDGVHGTGWWSGRGKVSHRD